MTKHASSSLIVAFVAAAYFGCGRNELDDGFPSTNVETGSGGGPSRAGSGGSRGSGGAPGAGGGFQPTGAGGVSGTGGHPGTAGATGGNGPSGAGGVTGGTGPGGGGPGGPGSAGISCGQMTCQVGSQSCCIQAAGGRRTETCIASGATCAGGPSVGCVGGDCVDGRVCCFSLLSVSTSCTSAQQCANALSTVLCGSDSDCPATRSHCCQAAGVSICRATACGGGPGGPGPAGPGRRN